MYLTTRVDTQTDWAQIAAMATAGTLKVGDEIADKLKTGEPVTYVVAHITEELVHFVSKDCLKQKYPWNKNENHQQNPGSFRDSYLCQVLNETVWDLLPDCLKAVITPPGMHPNQAPWADPVFSEPVAAHGIRSLRQDLGLRHSGGRTV